MATDFYQASIRRKLVIVGDLSAQKTLLLWVFAKGYYPQIYIPTAFENYVADVEVLDEAGKERVVELALYDTARQEDYDRLRPLSYPDTDVILLCFSVKEPDSFENIQEIWLPEIKHFCPGKPFIIVGHETDLGDDDDTNPLGERVTRRQGRELAKKVGAVAYMECCAKTGKGVNNVFGAAAKASLKIKHRLTKPSKLLISYLPLFQFGCWWEA